MAVCNRPPEKLIEVGTVTEGYNGIKASDMQIGGDHYRRMVIQPSAFIVANALGWYEGNAVKYICRHSSKGGMADIEKAIHYLNLLLEEEYGDGQ